MLYLTQQASPVGQLTLVSDGDRLKGLWMEDNPFFLSALKGQSLQNDPGLPLFARVKNWLERYFAGQKPMLTGFDLAPHATPFQAIVYELLSKIAYGQSISYGELAKQTAKRLGKPKMSAQAVGQALGRNPIAIIIPCHRVLSANGGLTGYAAGLARKLFLLRLEGCDVASFSRKLKQPFPSRNR